ATIDNLTRDLRLSGACLPANGTFVSLSGTNSTTLDSIVSRSGLLRSDLSCIRTTLTLPVAVSDARLPVASANGFAPDTRVYLRHPNGTGELFTLTAVDLPGNALVKTGQLSTTYPAGTGVFAVDERQYAIDTTTNPVLPVLTVGLNGATPIPFAS